MLACKIDPKIIYKVLFRSYNEYGDEEFSNFNFNMKKTFADLVSEQNNQSDKVEYYVKIKKQGIE